MSEINMEKAFFIFIGALVLIFAFFSSRRISSMLNNRDGNKNWKILQFSILFFIITYLTQAVFEILEGKPQTRMFAGAVILIGSLLSFLVFRHLLLVISDKRKSEEEIKRLNNEVQRKDIEIEVGNQETVRKITKNEEKYRKMVESIGDVLFTADANGYFTYVNPACEKLAGYKQKEIIGKRFTQMIAPEWRKSVEEFYQNQFDKKIDETLYSFQIITKYGEKKWVEQTVIQFREGDAVTGFRGVLRDISNRKSAEQGLKDSQDQLKTIFDSAPEAMIVIDEKGNVINWNPKAEQLFGWSREEVMGKQMHTFIVPEKDREQYRQGLENLIKTGIGPVLNTPMEITAINKSNTEIKVRLNVSKTSIKNKDIFIAFISDLSSTKRLEKQYQESEQFLESIIENIPSVIFVKDATNLTYLRFNKAIEKLMGMERKELLGKTDHDVLPKAEADFIVGNDREAIRKGTLIEIPEVEIETMNGKHWMNTSIIPLKDEKGNSSFVLGIAKDVTEERKKRLQDDVFDETIHENEYKLRQIVDNVDIGVVTMDLQKNITMINNNAKQLLKIRDQRITKTVIDLWENFNLFYPDQHNIFPIQNLPIETAIEGENTEKEIILEDKMGGEKKHVLLNGIPIKDQNGKIIAGLMIIKERVHANNKEVVLENEDSYEE